eukprot:gene40686-49608_t
MTTSDLKTMPLWKHAIAYVTLGLLCGWYYFIMLLYPTLLILMHRGSYIAGAIFVLFITLTFTPLDYKCWTAFQYSYIWSIWRDYFNFTYDADNVMGKFKKGERYFFFEFPHGVFPMAQFLSASVVREITPGTEICGTAADVVFSFPIMRQIMSWIGTNPAKKKNIAKVFESGRYCAVIPGGIAEMYVVSETQECVYLKKRINTAKTAIEMGAHVIPVYFFGNTKLFSIAGNDPSTSSWLSTLSRKMRASILLFYGRNYLPVPYRHPLRMVMGNVVNVVQKDQPSDADAQDLLDRVEKELVRLYNEQKPEWETRPLVVL